MSEEERKAFEALPDPVQVFRGFHRDGGERGFSWTTDREMAEWFAQVFNRGPKWYRRPGSEPDAPLLWGDPGGVPRVASGTVAKRDVLAYLLEREESEVLTLPEQVMLTGIERLGAGRLGPRQRAASRCANHPG
jgi:hypothetical protein